jgi:hypothetical protein
MSSQQISSNSSRCFTMNSHGMGHVPGTLMKPDCYIASDRLLQIIQFSNHTFVGPGAILSSFILVQFAVALARRVVGLHISHEYPGVKPSAPAPAGCAHNTIQPSAPEPASFTRVTGHTIQNLQAITQAVQANILANNKADSSWQHMTKTS